MKVTSDGTKGGLLVGPTDKEGGKGIPAVVGGAGGRQVILGGNEVIINENAVLLHCEELNKINQSTGGRAIDCGLQKKSNTHTEMAGGGRLPDVLTHEEVEDALGRSLRFLNDYEITINGITYEKMGLRTTYMRKGVDKVA